MDVKNLHSLRTKDCRSDQKNTQSGRHPSGIGLYRHAGKSLTHVKDSIPKYIAGQLVYKLSSQDCTTVYIGETSRSVADTMKEHSRRTKRHTKNNEKRTKLERSSVIALHVLETEHHVDFNNPEILSKNWPIYRDRMNAEQWFISHQPEACNLKGKTIHPAWNSILRFKVCYKVAT